MISFDQKYYLYIYIYYYILYILYYIIYYIYIIYIRNSSIYIYIYIIIYIYVSILLVHSVFINLLVVCVPTWKSWPKCVIVELRAVLASVTFVLETFVLIASSRTLPILSTAPLLRFVV